MGFEAPPTNPQGGCAMIECSVNLPEIKEFIKDIVRFPGQLLQHIRSNVQDSVGLYLTKLMEAELTLFLGRDRYKRCNENNGNYRNGYYERRFVLKGIGEVSVRVPRDRNGEFQTAVLPRSKQYEDTLRHELALMFLTGVSTRSLALISNSLIGRHISHDEVSKATAELTEAVEKWRTRDLSDELFKYLFIDGVNFRMRSAGSVEIVPVLVVVGVTTGNQKKVLCLQSGDKESAGTWREIFKDLKSRGLEGSNVSLGIMDGLPGLEKVFQEEFPKARIQRCQVHVARNVLAKVPRKSKKAVADDMRSIFYASSKDKAMEFFRVFKDKWYKEHPSATKCLEKNLTSCLSFFYFPKEEWISLRTTNIIERLNKEFKRRTKPMEIVAGETSCYNLLAFIALRMELHWRAKPMGKVRSNLPFFQEKGF
jgi:putative transposase